MSLTKFHEENFNEDHLHMWVPDFVKDQYDYDRPFLLWMYCVGLHHGFQNKYNFYIADYLLCVPHYTTAKDEIPRFNERYGNWVKIGMRDSNICWFQFSDADWTFVEHMEKKPRLQRMWIHLWNSVYTTKGNVTVPREDLFYTRPDVVATGQCTGEWQPFATNVHRNRVTGILRARGTTKYRKKPSNYLHKANPGRNKEPFWPKHKFRDE